MQLKEDFFILTKASEATVMRTGFMEARGRKGGSRVCVGGHWAIAQFGNSVILFRHGD